MLIQQILYATFLQIAVIVPIAGLMAAPIALFANQYSSDAFGQKTYKNLDIFSYQRSITIT